MRLALVSWTAAIGFLLAPLGVQGAEDAAKGKQQHFHLTMPHTAEQCLAALDNMATKDKKLFEKTDWGCKYGDHTGYVTVAAADEKAALAMVPEPERANAKTQQVSKFTPKEAGEIHKKVAEKK
jgi:hypothetical protein